MPQPILDPPTTSPKVKPFAFSSGLNPSFTHYLFRFPAKFHPPVARELISRYTSLGDTVLDPFCGSGTLLVEAGIQGRNSIGCDVDPLAVFLSQVKPHRYNSGHLRASADRLLPIIEASERPPQDYERLMFEDLSDLQKRREVRTFDLSLPALPNIDHWFRRYVQVDLACILKILDQAAIPYTHRRFFRLVFASILRNSSNADPVPVSGLEVTSHMRRRHREGRLINPYKLFFTSLRRGLHAVEEYTSTVALNCSSCAFQTDATVLSRAFSRRQRPDVIITSPPYNTAVDYYRRHKLEMFWLGLTPTQRDRLELLHHYLGRPKVPQGHPFIEVDLSSYPLASVWERRIRSHSLGRANSLRHYLVGMKLFFDEAAKLLSNGSKLIFVIADSTWRGEPLPTRRLITELASPGFKLSEQLAYPIKNRYMSYARHNGADIRTEHVLVFHKR